MVNRLAPLRTALKRFLQSLVLLLMAALAGLVIVAVVFRKMGYSIVWYDEVASILLAWITYYGAALGALHRAHIGFPGLVRKLAPRHSTAALVVREAVVLGFLAVLAFAGIQVFNVLGTQSLISLPWVPARVAHSVIPLGALCFMIAELLSGAEAWRLLRDKEEST